MKTMKVVDFIIIVMAFFTVGVITVGCSDTGRTPQSQEQTIPTDIDTDALNQFNALTPPVRLLAKDMSFKCWGVTLIDGTNKTITLGNMTALANQLGASYKIGDTIVRTIR